MNELWSGIWKVLLLSGGMILFNCTMIVLGVRFGWFLWTGKKLMALLNKKNTDSKGEASAGQLKKE